MDTKRVNPYHVSDIKTKEVVFSGGIGDYGGDPTGADEVVCIAPYAMKLTQFTIRADTVESADGTIDVKKAASGTALSSGTAMVTQLVPTTVGGLTALTNTDLTLNSTPANIKVAAGDLVVLMVGTVTELTGLAYRAVFERLE